MQGTIAGFKRSRRITHKNQMIIYIEGLKSSEDAKKLVGKKVVWKSPAGKEIFGEVRAPHGNSGAIRVLFEKGMPGQAISQRIEIIE